MTGGKSDEKKFADPNYFGYSQLLYEKKNEEILEKIIKRLKLNDQQRKKNTSPTLNDVRKYAQQLEDQRITQE